jgi:hypothetical protein
MKLYMHLIHDGEGTFLRPVLNESTGIENIQSGLRCHENHLSGVQKDAVDVRVPSSQMARTLTHVHHVYR